jgi:TetR/AcrR family transcriptional regulator, cholesterol catabolism regulator
MTGHMTPSALRTRMCSPRLYARVVTTGDTTAQLSPEQQDRRRRLIDAAFELGAEGGYDAVQMRDVSVTANVALATIYRYFSSKDDLLAAAMTEWTARLRGRVAQSPPRGATRVEQIIDVLGRACRAMERQPKLSAALVRALSSADTGVRERGADVQRQIASMGDAILADLDPEVRADILAVIGHVWYSSLVSWANGRHDFAWVHAELARAAHVLITPYEQRLATAPGDGSATG